jgi:hypothetical protein
MTYTSSQSKYADVMSTGAAITAIVALLRQQKAQAAGETFQLPPELLELLAAMATDINTITQWLASYQATIGGQGYPPNADQITVYRRDLAVAGVAIQLDDMTIPDDMELVIKSWPTNPAPPAGLVFVSNSKANAENALSSYPLITNEFRAFRIKNANSLWVSATVVPAFVSISAEKRP